MNCIITTMNKIISAVMILGGCLAFVTSARANELGFWDRFICTGTGTCSVLEGIRQGLPIVVGNTVYGQAQGFNPTSPTVVNTPTGSVLIVPNASGGIYPAAIIKTSN